MSKPPATDEWTLTHDFCFDYGGAERVLEVVAKHLLPDSPVWLLGGDPQLLSSMGILDRVKFLLPSSLASRRSYRAQAIAFSPYLFKHLAPMNLLALSYAFSHFPRSRGRKLVYCHSPLRQIWSGSSDYQEAASMLTRRSMRLALPAMRLLDRRAATAADLYVATSTAVADRIAAYYHRPRPPIIPPPIDTALFTPPRTSPKRDYYLWAGRVVEPYKRVGLVAEAFAGLPDERLVLAGAGRDLAAVRKRSPRNVSFLGPVGSSQLVDLYQHAKAVIYPSEDDFGMVPLEAMACGTPAIAYARGGALDTVVHRQTGLFFRDLSTESIRAAIRELDALRLDTSTLVAHADRFSVDAFLMRLRALL